MLAAQRVRAVVAAMDFDDGSGERIPVTISIGVAAFHHHIESLRELLDDADKALYRAKANGRDRVETNAE